MYKKIFAIALTMLMLVASIGYAANMQVNSSAVPSNGGVIKPNGIKFSSTFINYSVTAKAGYTLTGVTIDGATNQPPIDTNTYQVPFSTSQIHTIKANFAQSLYSIATTAGTGGSVLVTGGGNVNITPGSARNVIVVPNTGYKIASLTIDSSPITPADPTVAYTKSYTNIQTSKTVNATFSLLPTAVVYAGPSKTVGGTSTALTGSVTSNSTPSAYLWQVASGPAGTSFTNGTTPTPTFNYTAQGSYTVTLRATVGGTNFTSAPATIIVIGAGTSASNNCAQCHAGSAPVVAYPTSMHSQSPSSSCGACHNGDVVSHQTGLVTTAGAHNALNVNSRTVNSTTFVNVTSVAGIAKGAVFCTKCHKGGYPIPHPTANLTTTCANCHTTSGTGDAHSIVGAGVVTTALTTCTPCHTGVVPADVVAACATCHTSSDPHAFKATKDFAGGKTECLDCHTGVIAHPGDVIKDNNNNSGVRAIAAEFQKRSHHIINATGLPTSAQCAVCHLEGRVVAGKVVVDPAKHMADASIHLRNTGTVDADAEFVWSGTEHSNMDNFCFSCHNANGANNATVAAIMVNYTSTARLGAAKFSATNPFADTLKNGYDQVTRTGVVDVKTPFTTTNASHHAVSGQRYKYRFSTLANATVWYNRDTANRTMPTGDDIAEGHLGLDGEVILATEFEETMTGDFSLDNPVKGDGLGTAMTNLTATNPKGEGEATLYEAEKFVSTYVPLGATLSVADNSTLHCGDCHTVGQWKSTGTGRSTNADGSTTTVAIGAHGSNNEYLLRNSLGTDALHNNLTYVCFNCHKANLAVSTLKTAGAGFGLLHPVQHKNQVQGYATTHAVSAFHIQCLADSANNTGDSNGVYPDLTGKDGAKDVTNGTAVPNRLLNSWEGDKTTLDYLTAPNATAALPAAATSTGWRGTASGSDNGSGNITGIACTNCHNSGLRSGFGGIHGGDTTYTDGFGRTQKSYRFMPGMGNYRYAPPGGWDGKDTTITVQAGPGAGKPAGGCYTNSNQGAGDENPGYSACSHHGTAVAPDSNNPGILGGGTAKAPFTDPAAEYTVREATAGNALVTRPLKY